MSRALSILPVDVPEVKKNEMVFDPEKVITIAIEKGVSVDTMERLLAMRRELKAEAARDAFFSALAGFQQACPVIQKHKAVYSKDGKLRYKYAPLDDIVQQVKEFLKQFGFSYTIKTSQDAESFTAICEAHHVMGHSESTEFKVPIDQDSYMNAPQKVGSARTFAMRYAFCNSFGILTGDEDDDTDSIEPIKEQPRKEYTQKIAPTIKKEKPESTMYSEIISLLNARENKFPVFSSAEMMSFKKQLDCLRIESPEMKDFLESLKKVHDDRVSKIREVK